MSSNTTYYNLVKPAVNDPTDQDLWGGMLNSDLDIIDDALNTIATTAGRIPVGGLFFYTVDNANPSVTLGYGTWVAYGEGRVIVGVGTTEDDEGEERSFTLDEEGGAFSHELTAAQNGPHSHTVDANTSRQAAAGGQIYATLDNENTTMNTSSSGSGDPHNNVQPYIACYIWRRTA